MRRDKSPRFRPVNLARVGIDAAVYAVAVTAVATIAALVLGIATGGGVVRAKALLFLGGWVLMAYATVRLWPSWPEEADPSATQEIAPSLPETPEETRFQAFVQALPPNRWVRTPRPGIRMTLPGKLFLASLLVLLTSLLMEVAFGVT